MNGLGDSPPLWPQPPISALRRRRRPSPLLSPPVLIVVFPIVTLVFLFFAIPSFVSFSYHVLRPIAVKKSWDSLNGFLVLFAILCGIFVRRNDGEAPVAEEGEKSAARGVSEERVQETTLRRWFESGDDKIYGYDQPAMRSPGSAIGRLRRSSSSYPDLTQVSQWETGGDRFRFFDDFEVSSKYSSSSTQFDRVAPLRRWQSAIDEDNIKVIPVDTFILRTPPSPASPLPPPAAKSPAPPPPPTPPPPPVRHTYEAVAGISTGGMASSGAKFTETRKAPPAPPPPPSRPPPTPPTEYNYAKIKRRKSNAAKEIKMVLASVLYGQRKRKRQRTRTLNNDATPQLAPQTTSHSAVQPPPPPPPPPPASVFHSLFRKGSKSKRIHSVPTPPPPPPPPQEPRWRRTPKPPLPAKPVVHQPRSGARSPMIPMPPPPPSRLPEYKFVASEDFVRIRNSPGPEDVDVPSSPTRETTAATDGGRDPGVGEPGGPGMFCPSPDVNVKADTFIATLKAGWRLEKMNSIREKQSVGGPTPPPT